MKKFVVSSPSWFPSSGGLTILHKFTHTLNELGYDAYIAPSLPNGRGWPDSSEPHCFPSQYDKVKLITPEILDNLQDVIVICSQAWVGNYLSAPNVVRWMMGIPDDLTMSLYGKNDFFFWYTPTFKNAVPLSYRKNLDNDLYLGEFNRDIYIDLGLERTINTWTLRKAIGIDSHPVVSSKDYIHSPHDIFLGSLNPHIQEHGEMADYRFTDYVPQLVEILNKSKRFYSYDTITFLNIQAVMCGADSIICPLKGMTMEEYHKGYELHKFIAFGINDIERARSIRDEFYPTMDMIEERSIKQIHEFVDKCYQHFK